MFVDLADSDYKEPSQKYEEDDDAADIGALAVLDRLVDHLLGDLNEVGLVLLVLGQQLVSLH